MHGSESAGIAPTVSDYKVVRQLGNGSTGTVFLVKSTTSHHCFAMKTLERRTMTNEERDKYVSEVVLLKALDHPHIVKLVEVYETARHTYLIMEVLSGGELYDALAVQPEARFGEAHAAHLMRQVVSAVAYLHREGIVHRDIKLENFLFCDSHHSDLKLIDLGLSHRFSMACATSPKHQQQPLDLMHSIVGTPYYISPDVLAAGDGVSECGDIVSGYSEAVDSWSLGVVTYMLVSGQPPFKGRRDHEVLMSVRAGRYTFSGPRWAHISEDCKSFIRGLLAYNPQRRLSVTAAYEHPWLQPSRAALLQPLPPTIIHRMRRYAAMSSWMRAIMEVIAFTSTEEEIKHVRAAFEALDFNSSGVISHAALSHALQSAGVSASDAATLVDAADVGQRGLVYSSFVAAALPRSVITRERMREAFRAIDVKDTGFLTRPAFTALFGTAEGGVEALFSSFADAGGRLTFDRFFSAIVEGGGAASPLSSLTLAPMVMPSGGGSQQKGGNGGLEGFVLGGTTTSASPAAAVTLAVSLSHATPPVMSSTSRRPSQTRRTSVGE